MRQGPEDDEQRRDRKHNNGDNPSNRIQRRRFQENPAIMELAESVGRFMGRAIIAAPILMNQARRFQEFVRSYRQPREGKQERDQADYSPRTEMKTTRCHQEPSKRERPSKGQG